MTASVQSNAGTAIDLNRITSESKPIEGDKIKRCKLVIVNLQLLYKQELGPLNSSK